MDYRYLTIENCISKQKNEDMAAIIENGVITGFVVEKCSY